MGSITIENAIEYYLALRPANTVRAFRASIKLWETFNESKKLTGYDVSDCLKFINWLKHRQGQGSLFSSDATIKNRVHLLRRIFSHLRLMGLIDVNPFDLALELLPKRQLVARRPTRLIPFSKIPELLEAPPNNTKEGIRDRAILSILFGAGLRRSELLALNVEDVWVSESGVLCLKLKSTKAGKMQEQSLPSFAAERHSELISQRKAEGAKGTHALFVNYYACGAPGKRLSQSTLFRLFKYYTSSLGLRAAPHSARATAASWLKFNGEYDEEVMLFLRHSTPNMVRVYDKRARGFENNPGLKIEIKKNMLQEFNKGRKKY